jgi:hypothetical protein
VGVIVGDDVGDEVGSELPPPPPEPPPQPINTAGMKKRQINRIIAALMFDFCIDLFPFL